VTLFWLLLALHVAPLPWTQAAPCDTNLVKRGSALGDYGYRSRVGRCEGIFERSVSAPPGDLAIIGLVESFEVWDLGASNDVRIAWDTPPSDSIYLSATARRPLLFYRMDAARTATDTVFRWPFGVLAARRIPSRHVAVLARSRMAVGGATSPIYIPVRVGHLAPPRVTGTYRLVLLPSVFLRDLAVRVTTLAEDGSVVTSPAARPVHGGPFEPERGADVPLAEITGPGLYRVAVGGTRRDGSPANAQWLVLVPPRPAH